MPSPQQTIPAAEQAALASMMVPSSDPAVVTTTVGGGGDSRKATVNVISVDANGKRIITATAVTDVQVESLAATEQSQLPLTFGQVFAAGHMVAGQTVIGRLADGSTVPLQFDVKARHPDGSVRHGAISAVLPRMAATSSQTMVIATTPSSAPVAAITPATLLSEGFSAAAHVTLNGLRYSASADQLLRSGRYTTWLSGPIVTEWLVSAPLTTAEGAAHPHLTARFAIRAYAGTGKTRVDMTIENAWAFEAAPQNFVYDADLQVGGATVYSKAGMTHRHHARWRKVFWSGAEPLVHVKHNTAYLTASKALPNYDRSVVFAESTLAAMKTNWSGVKTEPMGVGFANAYMPSTGGREDIGLLPGWAATYLLSMDKRAKDVTLGTADLAGSWSIHYRNKANDRPVSLFDYPYMTELGNPGDTYNPATGQYESFPKCAVAGACATSNVHDTSHQPGFAYLPYLVTGDHYYLEELQFWAMYNTFADNPGYRDNVKGLFKPDQVRGQAWSLRTLAQAAYITPDTDPLKAQLSTLMSNNLEWYNANYTNNASANALGVLSHGYAIVYSGSTGIAPWMDDFFTSAVGYATDLGFDQAAPLLAWKSKFPVMRMTDPAACWIDGAIYSLKVRDSATSPMYTSMQQAYAASHTAEFNLLACGSAEMATALGLKVGEMTGYSAVGIGYPSNMQPALAYASKVSGAAGATAWSKFMLRTVKPDYSLGPQFAIVPR
ncbi:MAG: hypothetical protein V4723_10670 [Pseudomonadota bacterium]